jgi:hypothetical protein
MFKSNEQELHPCVSEGISNLTFQEINEKFFQMETDLNLFNQHIDGFYFWDIIRFLVNCEILVKLSLSEQMPEVRQKGITFYLLKIKYLLRILLTKNPFFSPQSDVVFVGHPRRRKEENGMWTDIFCDPIIENFPCRYTYLERTYKSRHYFPTKTRNVKYMDIISLVAFLIRPFIKKNVSSNDKETLKKISQRIASEFKVSIDITSITCKALRLYKSTIPVFSYLMGVLKPKLMILVVGYGNENIIAVCKAKGIPVIELQHGFIGRYHLGYSYPEPNMVKKTFPDYFFCFGDYWKKNTQMPIGADNVISIGYPYFENEFCKQKGIGKKDQVVFLSQSLVGKRLSKLALEFKKYCNDIVKIFYKLHPKECYTWKKEYPWLIDSGIEVVEDSGPPLHRILAESRIQVGVGSTAIYEGLAFGCITYLVDLPSLEHLKSLIDMGFAKKIQKAEEIEYQTVSQFLAPDKEFFFASNWKNNFSSAINKVTNTYGIKCTHIRNKVRQHSYRDLRF